MSKCKITGKVLVIQIGREDTRIALMDSGAQLLSSTTVATPAGAVEDGAIRNADAVRDMLKTALREPEFRRVHQAVFVLSSSQVIAETVTTPDLPAAKLEKLLQANVDSYFPVDMQDYQLVWQTIGRKERSNGAKELSVQLWAVPTAVLSRYYAVGNACGLSVAAVDYCGHSIATAVGASFASSAKAAKERKKLDLNQEISFGKKKNKETAEEETGGVATEVRDVPDTNLYLSLDSELLGMTFVQNGQVVLQRFIRCGDNPAYQAGELAMIVEYFRSLDHGRGSKINGMVFGSGAEDGRLILELEDFLGVQLQVFHTAYDSDMVICAGAARTTMDFGVPSLNAPGKERGRVQSQLWQYGAVLAGGLILIAVVLLLMSARLGWNSSLTTLESNKQMLTIKSQQTAGYADNYNAYVSAYNSYSADWDTVFASMQTYNDNLVLVLEELENMLPTNTSVTNLQIATDGMTVQFACADKEEAAYLIMALRELKYAELNAISNLSGGGGGPATSYGSGKTKEEPPTEGSSETAGTSAIRELIASELTKDELMGLARELSSEDIELLEQVYGQDPVTVYENLRTLKLMNASADQDVFFQQRSAALRELLTGNPFAMNRFLGLLEEDFRRDENAILWWFILDDLGSLGGVDTDDVESLRAFMNDLLAILTKDEETLNATEELLCTDVSVEKWYVYYLEVEMGLTQGEEFPYLNFDAIIEDLLQGGFDTGNDELDAKLNGLISDETWNLLKKLGTEEGMAEMLNKYLTENTTGDATVDAMIESYLTTGTTGYAGVDSRIESYLEGGSMDDEIAAVVEKYITTGTTDNAVMDGLIAAYLEQGTTGNTKLDALIERYINSVVDSITEEQLTEMMGQFISTGTTGNALYDNLLNKYMNTGSTGVDSLDALIQAYLESILGGDNNEGGGNEGGNNDAISGTATAVEDSKHVVPFSADQNGTLTITVGNGSAWASDVWSMSGTSPVQTGTAEATYTVDVVANTSYMVRIYGQGDPCAAISNIPYTITFTPSGTPVGPQLEEYVVGENKITEVGVYDLAVKNTEADTTLYKFEPTATGVYKVELTSGNVAMSQWSTSMYSENEGTVVDGVMTVTVTSVGQSVFIGLSGEDAAAQVTITKTGEASDEPDYQTIVYKNKVQPSKFDSSAYTVSGSVNIKDTTVDKAVLGTDGYYHLNSADGEILYVDFNSSVMSLTAAWGYGSTSYAVYDPDGKPISVTSYHDALGEYLQAEVKDGNYTYGNTYYPLTADLIEMLKNIGAHNDWYGENGLVGSTEDAWMFACVTMTGGTAGAGTGTGSVAGTGDNSKTGDALALVIAAFAVSGTGLTAAVASKKRKF